MTVTVEDLVPGFTLPALTRTITAEQIVSSSRGRESLWGLPPAGRNIHNDTETARSIGARDVVAGGVVTMALGWEMLLDALGDRWLNGGQLACTFVNLVCGGDELTVNANVREPAEGDAEDRVHLDISIENQEGAKVIVGKASVAAG